MATPATPQVQVFQEFRIAPSEPVRLLKAHISGPNALLHRYSDPDEKAGINVGVYDPDEDVCYPWPNKSAGGVVDEDYVKVFIDRALCLYHEDLIGDSSSGRGTVAPVADFPNRIRSSSLAYKANGTQYPRSSLFGDRDVQIGDIAYVRGVESPDDDCIEHEFYTFVEGFASDPVESSVEEAREEESNAGATTADSEITQTAGPTNCITATSDESDYDGLADGYPCETYTLTVVKSSISGCNAARLRVTSASGTDDASEVEVTLGEPVDIGTRGLKVTFTAGSGSCEDDAEEAGVAADQLVVGQVWEVEVCQTYERICAVSGGEYAGPVNDVYIVTVTKGGVWADLPEITVTTANGLDFSGPTQVTGQDVEVPIGTNGVTIKFSDCSDDEPGGDHSDSLGDGTIPGLCKNDRFYVTVLTAANGAIRTLILRDDLPDGLAAATDLDLKLYLVKDVEVTRKRVSNPPAVNYTLEATQLCLKAGVTTYDASWTKAGIQQPLQVKAGRDGNSVVNIQYREWISELCNKVSSINDIANIDLIPGPLHPDNPLKWGVKAALENSAGVSVWYTSVCEPNDLDSWVNVLKKVDGRSDMYNFAPQTRDRQVLNLFQSHIGAESSPQQNNWKGGFFNLLAKTSLMKVGQSAADAQLLHPTSTDGLVVKATVKDDPEATGTQYTRLTCTTRNGGFITYGVVPGDQVRYNFTIDQFGDTVYRTAIVDRVISESTIRLLETVGEPISQAVKIEIWHTLNDEEVVDDLIEQAQSFSDRRICCVWPDYVGTAGLTQQGYVLCASLAGLVSAVVPQQGLTGSSIAGYDDFSRSTNFLSATQLKRLHDGGVWIVTEDENGTPYTYHALTTDLTDLKRQEEMIRRNLDSISYQAVAVIKPYKGRANAQPGLIRILRGKLTTLFDSLTQGTNDELGGQVISYEITVLRVHPLYADRIEITVVLNLPAPANVFELHLSV